MQHVTLGVVQPLDPAGPSYTPPRPITAGDRLEDFACGKPALDAWLKAHALDNEEKASRTYVVTARTGSDMGKIVAYYTLAYGSVARAGVPRQIRHGVPDPVPVMILGRLAVDRRHSGHGIGPALLREAMQRTLQAAGIAGLRALIVHAIDDAAVEFYTKYGFRMFPAGSRTLFLAVETLRGAVA